MQMDTVNKLSGDLLICLICAEEYSDPVSLSCLHSFCRKCYIKYAESSSKERKSQMMPCPCCRQITRISDPARPVEEWKGHIKQNYFIQGLMDAMKIDNASKVIRDTIDIRTENDVMEPTVSDVTVLTVDGVLTIVCTDRANTCLKAFYSNNKQLSHSNLIIKDRPWGLTQLTKNLVLAAVPGKRQILIVKVSSRTLTVISTIRTGKGYYSIARLTPSTLVAGSCGYYASVDILSISGKVMKSVTSYNEERLFSSPWYMCVTEIGNVIVSDNGMKSVVCLTSKGQVVWSCSTKAASSNQPRGIAAVPTGFLLVERDSRKVVHLSESGHYVDNELTVTQNLCSPNGMFLDHDGLLYVCDKCSIKCFMYNA